MSDKRMALEKTLRINSAALTLGLVLAMVLGFDAFPSKRAFVASALIFIHLCYRVVTIEQAYGQLLDREQDWVDFLTLHFGVTGLVQLSSRGEKIDTEAAEQIWQTAMERAFSDAIERPARQRQFEAALGPKPWRAAVRGLVSLAGYYGGIIGFAFIVSLFA
jgi:hypothetical protein